MWMLTLAALIYRLHFLQGTLLDWRRLAMCTTRRKDYEHEQ